MPLSLFRILSRVFPPTANVKIYTYERVYMYTYMYYLNSPFRIVIPFTLCIFLFWAMLHSLMHVLNRDNCQGLTVLMRESFSSFIRWYKKLSLATLNLYWTLLMKKTNFWNAVDCFYAFNPSCRWLQSVLHVHVGLGLAKFFLQRCLSDLHDLSLCALHVWHIWRTFSHIQGYCMVQFKQHAMSSDEWKKSF